MAIIYTYPSGAVKADDLIIVSEQETAGSPTKNITVGALAAYLGGLPGGPWLPLSAGSLYPLTGDLYMAPTGAGPSVGSRNIVLRGVDDLSNELDSARIFTVDSTINPSGQDLYFQNANDVGVLSTGLFIDAFQQVAIAKTTANAQLDVGGSGNFDTTLLVGTSIGVNMGTPVNHEVDVAGNIRVEGDNAPGGPGTQGTYWLGGNASGDMNFGISSEGASTSTKKFYIGRAFNGITPYLTMWRTTGAPAGIEGRLQLNEYGTGNFITGSGGLGAAVYSLVVDASGNVIEQNLGALPWLYEYNAVNENFVQGEGPNPTGTGNTGYGVGSLPLLDAGQNNTAFGANTGLNLENSSDNVIIGYDAGRNFRPGGSTCDRNTLVGSGITFSLNPQGDDNTCVGYRAGSNIDSGFRNVFLGADAGRSDSLGADNVAIGYKALEFQAGSTRNIAIGSEALVVAETTASNNSAIGYQAGTAISTGDNNVLFGYQAGSTITTGTNNICIGYTSEPSVGTVDNEITIGNATHANIRLPGGLPKFPDDAAAGAGGILASMLYQTDGTAPAPLNVAGIVMIKQ